MENAELIFDEIDRQKKDHPSFEEIFSDFDKNYTLFMDNIIGVEDEEEAVIFGTSSSY